MVVNIFFFFLKILMIILCDMHRASLFSFPPRPPMAHSHREIQGVYPVTTLVSSESENWRTTAPDSHLRALIWWDGRWLHQGAGNIIKVCPRNVIFQRRARAGSGTDDGSSGGTKHGSIWEQRDGGLRAGIPLGRWGWKSEVKGR